MPRLIPPVDVDSIEPYSEQQVISELVAQLPAECRLYHNFEILTSDAASGKSAGKQLSESEIDAVILWPDKGLLVLEVKGGDISYCADRAKWMSRNRNGVYDIKDPFAQARHNMHGLIKSMEGTLGAKQKGALTHGYAVVFPTSRIEGALPLSADTVIVCDASRLQSIGRFVDGALKSWRRRSVGNHQMPFDIEQVHRAMLPVFNLVPSLKSRVAGDNEQLLRLTEDQRKFLDFSENMTRARIDGVAGSGKTLLAVEQARRYASAGKRTLLLCYNKSLAAWLRNTLAAEATDTPVDIHTFHDFCAQACTEAGVEFDPAEGGQDFWNERSAELLADASHMIKPYDAIVIDEGQDFRETWWLAIEDCLVEKGHMMVFCDPRQDIFGADGLDAIDVGDRVLNLPENCRNTQAIARFCDNIIDITTRSPARSPGGIPVEIKVEKSEEKRLDKVIALVEHWVSKEGLLPSQIAILSPWRRENTCLADVVKLGRTPLTESIDEWQKGAGILQTTVRTFKGLEADVLLLIDVPAPDAHKAFSSADYYVGCSRAKSVLYVLARDAAVSQLAKAA